MRYHEMHHWTFHRSLMQHFCQGLLQPKLHLDLAFQAFLGWKDKFAKSNQDHISWILLQCNCQHLLQQFYILINHVTTQLEFNQINFTKLPSLNIWTLTIVLRTFLLDLHIEWPEHDLVLPVANKEDIQMVYASSQSPPSDNSVIAMIAGNVKNQQCIKSYASKLFERY